MALDKFLFERPLSNGKTPLFASQLDLAKCIAGVQTELGSNVQSIRANVNQVLQRHRRPSDDFKLAIQEAVKHRLREQRRKDPDGILRRLRHELELGLIDPEQPLDDIQEFNALEEAARSATCHFILNHRPAELRESEKAEFLKQELVERLGLVDHAAAQEESTAAAKYVFNVPDRATASKLWFKLHEFLDSRTLDSAEQLQRADDTNRLQVNVVPAHFCIPPIVVFDPDDVGLRGFVLEHHEKNAVSVARLSRETLFLWHKCVYEELTINSARHGVDRIRFSAGMTSESGK
jgi:hypothetical protein